MNASRRIVVALLAIAVSAATQAQQPSTSQASAAKATEYGNLPLSFEANQGQTDSSVRFLSRGGGYSLYLTDSAAVLSLSKGKSGSADTVRMELSGANSKAKAAGAGQLPGISNYFIGNDPAKWRSNIPTYAKVRYSGVYPGVDLVYYGNQRQLEYDFVVAPNADPDSIKLHFAGAKKLSLTPAGDLKVEARNGEIAFHKPEIYQQIGEKRTQIPGQFKLLAKNNVRFELGLYDRSVPLVIDPVLSYSTYLGGTTADAAYGIAVDSEGSAYVVGTTYSSDFPAISGAYQPTDESFPAIFITKFNPTGSALVYSTFLSGNGSVGGGDYGTAIAVDASGNAYITGTIYSPNFPVTTGAFQTTPPMKGDLERTSAFVTKLNPTGSRLLYSTYLGGSTGGTGDGSGDAGTGIAIDSAGNAYIAGFTTSTNFPVTSGAFQTTLRSGFCTNAFVSKLNPTGAALVYSTYLGGEAEQCSEVDRLASRVSMGDWANAIAVDAAGDAYVAGNATSLDFPVTTGAFQTANKASGLGLGNAFITKLNPSGSEPVYSTFLGGDNLDDYLGCDGPQTHGIQAIAVDASGDAFVTGSTIASDFPTTAGSLQKIGATPVRGDCPDFGFVTKLNPAGSQLVFSSFLGGDLMAPSGIAIDSAGNSYLTGTVYDILADDGYSSYFNATQGAISTMGNLFVAKLNPSGAAMEYATSMGGESDAAKAIAVDGSGNAYITGQAISTNFPTTGGAFQKINKAPNNPNNLPNQSGNAFVSKLALSGETGSYVASSTWLSSATATAQVGQSGTVTAHVTGSAGAAAPTGSVSFFAQYCGNGCSTTTPVQATLNSSGVATATIPNLKEGNYTFYANYLGDDEHLTGSSAATSTALQTLVLGPPATLINYPPIGTYGKTTSLEAQVTDAVGYQVVGATVNFSAPKGYQLLATSAVTGAGGYATVPAIATAVGYFDTTVSVSGTSLTETRVAQNLPAPLTVLVHIALRDYGSPNPPFASTIQGLVGSDSVTVNYQTSATAASPVGSYPLTGTLGGVNASNYVATFVPSTVQVNPAPLTIIAKNETSIYGKAPAPPTAYTLTGFVNGDTASVVHGAPVLSTPVTATSPVGFYPTAIQVGTLTAANYTFLTHSNGIGGIQVAKAPLAILPNSVTIHAGDPLPSFTYSITGFVNGDTQASATTGTPTLTTNAPNTNTPGRYYIIANIGTLAAHNYDFNQPAPATDGILTILPD